MTRAQITLTLVRDDDDDAADLDATVEVSGTDAAVQRAMGRLGDVLTRAALEVRKAGPKSVRPSTAIVLREAEAV